MQRRLCAAILSLEAIALGLSTPVLISVAGVSTATALWIGLGLTVACILVAGLLRFGWAYGLGWAIQVAAIALGFVIHAMFVLGAIFMALWATAYFLGSRIERERAEWAVTGEYPGLRPGSTRRRPLVCRAMSQRTLVLLKPDAVRRGLVGNILSRFEAKGLTFVAMEQRHIDAAQADKHYAEHVERDFYPPLRDFVTGGPLIAVVLEGDEAIEVVRAINGATDGRKAAPGTIRGDLSLSNRENLVHGSDSEESAAREISPLVPRPLSRVSPREEGNSLLGFEDGRARAASYLFPFGRTARRIGWPTVSSAATWRST